MATCTLNSGTAGSSGGNSGYQLVVGATGKTASGPWSASPGYPYKVTSVSVPWFGYTTGGTLSISGTVTITIKSGSTTIGSLSGSVSSTIYSNTNTTGSVSCTGTINCTSGTSYTLTVSCSGSNLLKSGVRFTTNGKSLTVNYSAQTYVVSYSANGHGSAPAAQTKTAGTTLTLQPYIASQYTDYSGTITGNANGGTWSGSNGSAKWRTTYTQGGWNTNSAGTGTNYGSKGSYTANAGATLYAKWGSSTAGISYTLPTGTPTSKTTGTIAVYFNANGNGASTSKTSQNSTKTTSYAFDGWYTAKTGGTKRTTSSRVTTGEIVYAHYSSSATNTASAVTCPTTSQCTWSGHTLLGWSTSSSATSATYSAGGSYTPPTNVSSITLYAIWSTSSYTLTYAYDDGTTQQVTTAYNALVSPPIPQKSGYKLLGWGRTGNGTAHQGNFGRGAMYTDKISIHFNAYKDDWSTYGKEIMLSCTEGGGWGIGTYATTYTSVLFEVYDNGASGYKDVYSSLLFSEMKPGWHSFDLVFNGTNFKCYIDDELVGTSANFSGAPSGTIKYNATNNIYLGAEPNSTTVVDGYYFNGKITAPLILHQGTKINKDDLRFVMPAGNWTIYPMWVRANHINVYYNNEWSDVPIYVYHNGEWQPAMINTYINDEWQQP